MTSTRILLVVALLLTAFSLEAGDIPPPGQMAVGSIGFLVSKRCEQSPTLDPKGLEWPALVYSRGKPPAWGKKMAGACRGLDTWVLSEAVAAGVYWGQTDPKTIEADPNTTLFDPEKGHAAFKNAFGWDLPERGDDLPAHDVFLKYNAKKVETLFNSVYVKPTNRIGLLTGQEVYDHFFKPFMTRLARETALIKSNIPKPQLAKLVKDYQAAAKKEGSKFRGPKYLKEVVATTLPKDEESSRAARTLGTILRRTADGTWPTVNRLLKKTIADYDPALAKELGNKI